MRLSAEQFAQIQREQEAQLRQRLTPAQFAQMKREQEIELKRQQKMMEAARGGNTEAKQKARAEKLRTVSEKLREVCVRLMRADKRIANPEVTSAQQVIYRLEMAQRVKLRGGAPRRAGPGDAPPETMEAEAARLEASDRPEDELDLEVCVLFVGKRGVGKTAAMQSIIELGGAPPEEAAALAAGGRDPGPTKGVREVRACVLGIRLVLVDTPGLDPGVRHYTRNVKMLSSVRRKYKHHCLVYVDRLDLGADPRSDSHIFRAIGSVFSPTIWQHSTLLLAHAAAPPPEGSDGVPLQYDGYVAERSHVLRSVIRASVADVRLNVPVCLGENHPLCRRNRGGDRVLPNGKVWVRELMQYLISVHAIHESSKLFEQASEGGGELFGRRPQQRLSTEFLLSSLFATRKPQKPKYGVTYDIVDLRRARNGDELVDRVTSNLEHKYGMDEKRANEANQKEGKPKPKSTQVLKQQQRYQDDLGLSPSFDPDNSNFYRYEVPAPSGNTACEPLPDNDRYDHESGLDGGVGFGMLGYPLSDRMPCLVRFQGYSEKSGKSNEIRPSAEGDMSVWRGKRQVISAGMALAPSHVPGGGYEFCKIFRANLRQKWLPWNRINVGGTVVRCFGTTGKGFCIEDKLPLPLPLVRKDCIKAIARMGMASTEFDRARAAELELKFASWPFGLFSNFFDGAYDTDGFTSTFKASVAEVHGQLRPLIISNINMDWLPLTAGLNTEYNPSNGEGKIKLTLTTNDHMWMALAAVPALFTTLFMPTDDDFE